MNYHIDLQHACAHSIPVADELLIQWAELTLAEHKETAELTLRLVDEEEMTHLNHTYRQQNKTTNVLAFPSAIPDDIELDFPLLGDVIICPSVLQRESQELGKPVNEHWAHIVIHGVLHLLGYDHIKDSDAEIMQALEIKLLAHLGFANPYQIEGDNIE
ncbi:rRNA maturation RNase YbeY [Legionella micdadei]|uniref:Endoribonuclease YbeY n=1 Tax=Legionella micdadei TaxID=451 RepID=A0A098GHX9_LEGMI|nr:rRNA maturation RNase YbeY [Legionella micdadei]ARG97436.1 rRNA maturation RNase YbeY [Legionella micdadei]ARH00255.1 rRNA maturation RNase YbeY [Legionella micdadei]KTD28329.1 metal-dependent hydrolase [Legionella micdadei]NSL16957.1 rRNA maturation RNase YbeY [Legionella micdadei]CEG61081.1 putative metal-dependent hydrolase [Legionella micdadei]